MGQIAHLQPETTIKSQTLGEISFYKQEGSDTIYACRGHEPKVDLTRRVHEFYIPSLEDLEANMAIAKQALETKESIADVYALMLECIFQNDKIIYEQLKEKGSRDVLILGLGGGYLALGLKELEIFQFQEIMYNIKSKVTGVELDPNIVKVSKRFNKALDGDGMCVVIGDGLLFVNEYAKSKELFDYIIVDVFTERSGNISNNFVIEKTLKTYQSILNPGGQVMINIHPKDYQKSRHVGSLAVKVGYDVEEIADSAQTNILLILTKRSVI